MADTTKRLKIADADVAENHRGIKFTVYHPDRFADTGKQLAAHVHDVNIEKFPADMLHHCAAIGFATLAGNRYRRKDDIKPDEVLATIKSLETEILDGTWTPGRESGPAEPSPFVEALAQLTNTPTHVIEQQMRDNPTKWTKGYMSTVRRDPRVAAKVNEIVAARAVRDGKAAREKMKGARPSLQLGSLFEGAGAGAAAA